MGSYTDVAIAIDKETYARHALLQKVPAILSQEPYVEVANALHWYLENQSWRRNNPVVMELYAFFDLLEEEGDIDTGKTWVDHKGRTKFQMVSRYGCTLLHEGGDTEELGYPHDFDISHVVYIDCPGRDAMLEQEKKLWTERQLAKESSE